MPTPTALEKGAFRLVAEHVASTLATDAQITDNTHSTPGSQLRAGYSEYPSNLLPALIADCGASATQSGNEQEETAGLVRLGFRCQVHAICGGADYATRDQLCKDLSNRVASVLRADATRLGGLDTALPDAMRGAVEVEVHVSYVVDAYEGNEESGSMRSVGIVDFTVFVLQEV